MATIVEAEQWPTILEREAALSYIPDFNNESGPPALDGSRQVRNITGGGLWRARLLNVALRTTDHLLTWQGLEALLEGGKTPIDVPMLLCNQRPTPANSDPIVITADGGMAARAITGTIDLENSGPVKVGMHFSAYDETLYGWRMYRIVKCVVGSGGASTRDIQFWPPFRFGVPNNYAFDFTGPRCVCVLDEDDSMGLTVQQRRRGDPSALFIEAF